jgi:hypothetical protein
LGARFGNINFKLIGGWSKMGYARQENQEINPWASLIKRYMPGIASPSVSFTPTIFLYEYSFPRMSNINVGKVVYC